MNNHFMELIAHFSCLTIIGLHIERPSRNQSTTYRPWDPNQGPLTLFTEFDLCKQLVLIFHFRGSNLLWFQLIIIHNPLFGFSMFVIYSLIFLYLSCFAASSYHHSKNQNYSHLFAWLSLIIQQCTWTIYCFNYLCFRRSPSKLPISHLLKNWVLSHWEVLALIL